MRTNPHNKFSHLYHTRRDNCCSRCTNIINWKYSWTWQNASSETHVRVLRFELSTTYGLDSLLSLHSSPVKVNSSATISTPYMYYFHCLFRLIIAEPLEEILLFWKGYFYLDGKHATRYLEAFKTSVRRSSKVSLSLSEIHFPQIYGKPEISDRFIPSCPPSFTIYLFSR